MKLLLIWFALTLPGWCICPDRLQSVLESGEPSARLGVVVKVGDRVLVDIDGGQSFIPASVQKLFTTAAALTSLGAEFRIKTVLAMSRQGELQLIGGGDPSFSSDRDLPQLVGQLSGGNIPIKSIAIEPEPWGNIYGKGWEWADTQAPYAAPIGGIVIDENILEWQLNPGFSWKYPQRAIGWQGINTTTLGQNDTLQISIQDKKLSLRGTIPGPIEYASPIPDPGEQFLNLLQQELHRQEVRGLSVGEAVLLSPPLKDLVKITNKNSNNLYAEQILRILGRHYQQLGQDYETRGRTIVSQLVHTPGFYLADGSGLSRHNQTTPRQIVELLSKMADHPQFRASLPIGGKDGTLTHRLKHLDVQAKTGTMTGIGTLAGYLQPPRHPPVVFAIVINHSLKTSAAIRTTIDAMVEQINQLTLCDPSPE